MQYIHPLLHAAYPDDQSNEEQARVARLLINFLWGSIIIALVTLPSTLLTTDEPILTVLLHICTVILGVLSLVRVQQGHVKWVALALPITVSIITLFATVFGNRPFSLGISAALIAVVFTGMIGHWRILLVVVGINIAVAVVSVVYWLNVRPHPIDPHNLLVDATGFIWYSIIMGFVVLLSSSQLREALSKARIAKLQVNERNAELEREIAERRQTEANLDARTRELAQLLEMSKRVSATLDLQQLLDLIIELLKPVVNYDSITISECVSKTQMRTLTHRGIAPSPALDWFFDLGLDCYIAEAIDHQAPVVIADVYADTVLARSYRERCNLIGKPSSGLTRSIAYVPLVSRNRVLGLMTLQHATPNAYSIQSLRLVAAFANQMAVSIESAWLHERAVQAAALTERSRLARELHDSVSQALFGIVLGSRTLLGRTGSETSQANTVEYVLSLAEAALAEMRALIFELRPESLQTEGLVVAFRKQASALCSRHKIDVDTHELTLEPEVGIEVKEALYRIGLEAIQNTIKHARATRVNLRLRRDTDKVLLEIKDNGRGFDTGKEFPGHLGLHTMRERAEHLGGSFVLQSSQGQGTLVQVKLPILSGTHAYAHQITRIQLVDDIARI